ncbi:MAG: tRNA (N6-isopentenyl adenosine(37)-C2)-methylthiotransferase MiaB [Alphaproteobacteria bacterium]
MKKLYIKTYGCQMNVYDSERMIDILKPLGFEISDDPAEADMAILNTCHIREKAEQKVYSDLGRLRQHQTNRQQEQKELFIAVTGCVAQAEGAEIFRQAPYVSMVLGPQTYHRLPEMIAKMHRSTDKRTGPGRGIIDVDFPSEAKFDSLPLTQETRVSAFLTVQEGCDKFCSFCCVPYTRGAEFSRPAADILKEAKHLVKQGATEITLLGQNVNAYHGQTPQGQGTWGLGDLIQELALIEGLKRIRYTTSHPIDMADDLMQAHAHVPQLMPYLHLPVQSGSDTVLKAMNRHHTIAHYKEVIAKLRALQPAMAFSSDFIVGHPGETDQDFEETLTLVRDITYAQAYSFKYSPRPGTPAATEQQIPETIKAARLAVLQELLNEQQLTFNKSKIGTIQSVLLDRQGRQAGQFIGRSPYMQSVHVEAKPRLWGQIVDVAIDGAKPNSLSGTIVTQ